MTCRDCGEPLNELTDFCPNCGIAIEEPTEEENRDLGDIREMKRDLMLGFLAGLCTLALPLVIILFGSVLIE